MRVLFRLETGWVYSISSFLTDKTIQFLWPYLIGARPFAFSINHIVIIYAFKFLFIVIIFHSWWQLFAPNIFDVIEIFLASEFVKLFIEFHQWRYFLAFSWLWHIKVVVTYKLSLFIIIVGVSHWFDAGLINFIETLFANKFSICKWIFLIFSTFDALSFHQNSFVFTFHFSSFYIKIALLWNC